MNSNRDFFHCLRTSSRTEREIMALEVKRAYNNAVYAENEAYDLVRRDSSPGARSAHNAAMAALGHMQNLFDILGIEYQPGRPFDLSP